MRSKATIQSPSGQNFESLSFLWNRPVIAAIQWDGNRDIISSVSVLSHLPFSGFKWCLPIQDAMTNCRHLERPIPSLGNGLAPAARAAQSAGEESFHVLLSLMQMIDASRSLLSLERSGTIPMPLPSSLAPPCFPSSLLENNPLIVKSKPGWLVSHPMMVSLDLLPWDSVRTLHSPSLRLQSCHKGLETCR